MNEPVVVDARGLRCPAPVIRLARAAAHAAAGTELTVLATDPAAVHDVPAWARMRGHTMVSATETDGVHALTVRTKEPTADSQRNRGVASPNSSG